MQIVASMWQILILLLELSALFFFSLKYIGWVWMCNPWIGGLTVIPGQSDSVLMVWVVL